MVANAGIALLRPFLESALACTCFDWFHYQPHTTRSATTEEFRRIQAVNVEGVMHCFKYGALQMIKQGRGGRIIGQSPSILILIGKLPMQNARYRGMLHGGKAR